MDVDSVKQQLLNTLSSNLNVRKPAEDYLLSISKKPYYSPTLLKFAGSHDMDINVRVPAAITFKNFIKENWAKNHPDGDIITQEDRNTIKGNIVNVMVCSPQIVQRQMSDSIGIIGHEDFPDQWKGLLDELVARFECGNFDEINGVLRTAHSLFKRYRIEFKSQKLWEEIKFVLINFAAPFTKLFEKIMQLMSVHNKDAKVMEVLINSSTLVSKIFYSLNIQELPEHFEDNLPFFMNHFLNLMSLDDSIISHTNDNEPGPLQMLKTEICSSLIMFTDRYSDEFAVHLGGFVDCIWALLMKTGDETKNDVLVSNAISFLAIVASRPNYTELFSKPETLTSICEKVIVPNMQFREADEELFFDDADEYIRKDIEGSDVDTRRRSACDLVKALSTVLEGAVIRNFSTYVVNLLNIYTADPTNGWKSKDVAIFLVTSMASKAKTMKHGVTQTSELVNIVDFFNQHILPELQAEDINDNPVLKADCIKYIMVFRSQLDPSYYAAIVPILAKFLLSNNRVVHSYAAYTLEKLFCEKKGTLETFVSPESVKDHVGLILRNLFITFSLPDSSVNEHVMKTIARTLVLFKTMVLPYITELVKNLTAGLIRICKNPYQPNFNHYLFESLSLAMNIMIEADKSVLSDFEASLFPIFDEILITDIAEFVPYVFQLSSTMLSMHSKGELPNVYAALLTTLIKPTLYNREGNIIPLIKLLMLYLDRGFEQIPQEKFMGILGVYQKMISSRKHEKEGFLLLESIVNCMSVEHYMSYNKQISFALFTRLSKNKTNNFVHGFIKHICQLIVKHQSDTFIMEIEQIQSGMFAMILNNLLIPNLKYFIKLSDRRIVGHGMVNLLVKSEHMLSCHLRESSMLLNSLITMWENPVEAEKEIFVMDEEDDVKEYQNAFSKLTSCYKKANPKKIPTIDQLKMMLVCGIGENASKMENIFNFYSHQLNNENCQLLTSYLKTGGINL